MLRNCLLGLFSVLLINACSSRAPKQLNPDSVIKGVNYVGVSVSDLDVTEDFLAASDMLAVQNLTLNDSRALQKLSGRETLKVETRMLRSVNAQLRAMHFEDRSTFETMRAVPVNGPGIAHVCFQVAQETNAYQNFIDKNAEIIGDPDLVRINPRNPVYYGYIKDPDGAVIEVEEVDLDELNLKSPPPNEYRVRHVSLATPDIRKLVDFYSILLGQPKPRAYITKKGGSREGTDGISGLPGSKLNMAWFQIRNLELELIEYVSHPVELPATPRPVDAPGYNMIVFDVEDIEATLEKLVEAGGSVETEEELMDGSAIVFGRDPDGNILGFQTAPADSVVSAKNFSGNGTQG